MQEELGFTVKVKDLVSAHLYTITRSFDESRGVLVLSYTCEVLDKNGIFELEGEAGKAEFQKFPISEVKNLQMPNFYKEAIARAHKDSR